MQRDARTPSVRRGPDEQAGEHDDARCPPNRMRSGDAEINQDDDRGNRNAIADDCECPRVAGIALVDQAAHVTGFKVTRPTRVQRSEAAMRTALVKSTSQRPQDEIPPAHDQGRASRPPAVAGHFRGAARLNTFHLTRDYPPPPESFLPQITSPVITIAPSRKLDSDIRM
jgi:hypothetical protein